MYVPHIKIYTDNLAEGVGGSANAFVIRILPKYKDDAGILRHELVHVKQWWTTSISEILGIALAVYLWKLPTDYFAFSILGFAVHSMLYSFVTGYRLHSEAQAYAVQCKSDRSDLDVMAMRLALPLYKLGITKEVAKREIDYYL